MLDSVGTVLVGVGLWQLITATGEASDGFSFLRHWAIPLVIAGILLMVPFILWAIKLARKMVE